MGRGVVMVKGGVFWVYVCCLVVICLSIGGEYCRV